MELFRALICSFALFVPVKALEVWLERRWRQ
ncbi:hypothetical protein JOE21_002445 [Desmospora profundinema]|uniref:Uncharacterized protein n=1 Tax=Desmospora profundinema TaxID=1571184 RepID=A0ABU1INU6_9BACL|nr:hypothetical protein [Desmospora profundinema]